MKRILSMFAWGFCGATALVAQVAGPLDTAFTFQGRLTAGGAPANGLVDLRFALFDANTGGTAIGMVLTNIDVEVSNGLFTTVLDFGPAVFTGGTYWLETSVRPAGSGSTFGSPLLPRQAITSTPYALFAANAQTAAAADSVPWSGLSGIPQDFQDGMDNDTQYSPGPGLDLKGNQFSVAFSGSGSADMVARSDHTHAAADVISGTLDDARLSGNVALLDRATQSFTGANYFTPATDTTGLTVRPARVGGAVADVVRVENANGTRTLFKVGVDGQMAQSSGAFSADGDAQSGTYVLRRTTTTSAPTELFLDGASQRLLVPANAKWVFDILVVASGVNGFSAGFTVKGVIKNVAGATTLVGSSTPITATTIASDDAGLVVTVEADNTNDALVIKVVGESFQNMRWVATVRTSELIF